MDPTSADSQHRLTDIRVEEVSLVDRAANLRRFVVVKSAGGSVGDKAGAEVVSDTKGGHTTTPAATQTAKKLQLAPTLKAALAKSVDGIIAAAQLLKAEVEGAEEVATATTAPAELVGKLDNMVATVVEAGHGAEVAKAYKQVTPGRLGQIEQAYSALGAVLSDVKPKAEPAAAAPAAQQGVTVAEVAAAVTKQLEGTLLEPLKNLTTALEGMKTTQTGLTEAVNKQEARITTVEKSEGRVASNAAPVEKAGGGGGTAPAEAAPVWTGDLNEGRRQNQKR